MLDANLLPLVESTTSISQYNTYLGMTEFGSTRYIICHLQKENAIRSIAETGDSWWFYYFPFTLQDWVKHILHNGSQPGMICLATLNARIP